MALINISNLTFGYEGSYDLIFEDASFQLDTAWRTGLVGRNGRGKTTLLRLLTGDLDSGGAISAGERFVYFPPPPADPGQTVLQAARAACPDAQTWQLERELSLLGLPESILPRPLSGLSHGERTKALLAAFMLREDAFLLIDEPTNHLDMLGREKVSAYLSRKAGFIVVSHDRAFLDGCVDHILAINRRDIQVQRGNLSSWLENKRREDAFELAENARLKKDVRRLNEAARRTADWSDKTEKSKIGTGSADRGYVGHKAAKMMQRAQNIARRRESAAEQKAALLTNLDTAEPLKLAPLVYHSRRLAELRDITVRRGGREIVRDVTFSIEQGERIALTGPNGSGKSTLLGLILGQPLDHTGLLRLGGGLKISYVPQSADALSGSLMDYARQSQADPSLLLAILRKLDLPRPQFEKDLSDFSQGQKKKVLLARSLCQQAHLYIWDEPLNYIDLLSRMQIESLILAHRPTLLFVEHDRTFGSLTATRTVALPPAPV